MAGGIDAILEQGPQWVRNLAAQSSATLAGLRVDPDLAHLEPSVREEITKMSLLADQLMTVVTDETIDEEQRAEGLHVLSQLEKSLNDKGRVLAQQVPIHHDYNAAVTKIYRLLERFSLLPAKTQGSKHSREPDEIEEGQEDIELSEPARKIPVKSDEERLRLLFEQESELFIAEFHQKVAACPLSEDLSSEKERLSRLMENYSEIQSNPTVAEKRTQIMQQLEQRLIERQLLLSAIEALSIRKETIAKLMSLPQVQVRELLSALSVLEHGYMEDLRQRIEAGHVIDIQAGVPVPVARYLQGAFSMEEGDGTTLLKSMVSERLDGCVEEVTVRAMMASPLPILPAYHRQALARHNLSGVVDFLHRMQGPGYRFRIQLQGVFYEATVSSEGNEIILRRWKHEEQSLTKTITGMMSRILGWQVSELGDALSIHLGADGTVESVAREGGESSLAEALALIKALEAKAVEEQTPIAIEQEKLGFQNEDLITFKTLVLSTTPSLAPGESTSPTVFELGSPPKKYFVWATGVQDGVAVNIQDEASQGTLLNKIGMKISPEGRILSLYVNDAKVASLTDSQRELIFEAFVKAQQLCSRYEHEFWGNSISVVMRSPRQLPLFHLRQLVNLLEKTSTSGELSPRIRVQFILDDLTEARGIDAGGLSRAYLDDLFQGVVHSGWQRPLSRLNDHFTPFPAKGHEEIYQQLGEVFMWCFLSQSPAYTIGEHFSPAIFAAALSLSSDQLLEEPMSEETRQMLKQEFLKAAAASDPESTWGAFQTLKEVDRFVKTWTATDENNTILRNIIQLSSYDSESMTVTGTITSVEQLLPILNKSAEARTHEDKETLQRFSEQVQAYMARGFADALNDIFDSSQIDFEAIREIARGMQRYCSLHPQRPWWPAVRSSVSPKAFSEKIQGTTDRRKIIDSLEVKKDAPQWLLEKAQYLREWIVDPSTTDQEIRTFLKWVTGATSITDKGISLWDAPMGYAVPRCHTCFHSLDICEKPYGLDEGYPYSTKEGFLHYIKIGMSAPTSFDLA